MDNLTRFFLCTIGLGFFALFFFAYQHEFIEAPTTPQSAFAYRETQTKTQSTQTTPSTKSKPITSNYAYPSSWFQKRDIYGFYTGMTLDEVRYLVESKGGSCKWDSGKLRCRHDPHKANDYIEFEFLSLPYEPLVVQITITFYSLTPSQEAWESVKRQYRPQKWESPIILGDIRWFIDPGIYLFFDAFQSTCSPCEFTLRNTSLQSRIEQELANRQRKNNPAPRF